MEAFLGVPSNTAKGLYFLGGKPFSLLNSSKVAEALEAVNPRLPTLGMGYPVGSLVVDAGGGGR